MDSLYTQPVSNEEPIDIQPVSNEEPIDIQSVSDEESITYTVPTYEVYFADVGLNPTGQLIGFKVTVKDKRSFYKQVVLPIEDVTDDDMLNIQKAYTRIKTMLNSRIDEMEKINTMTKFIPDKESIVECAC